MSKQWRYCDAIGDDNPIVERNNIFSNFDESAQRYKTKRRRKLGDKNRRKILWISYIAMTIMKSNNINWTCDPYSVSCPLPSPVSDHKIITNWSNIIAFEQALTLRLWRTAEPRPSHTLMRLIPDPTKYYIAPHGLASIGLVSVESRWDRLGRAITVPPVRVWLPMVTDRLMITTLINHWSISADIVIPPLYRKIIHIIYGNITQNLLAHP